MPCVAQSMAYPGLSSMSTWAPMLLHRPPTRKEAGCSWTWTAHVGKPQEGARKTPTCAVATGMMQSRSRQRSEGGESGALKQQKPLHPVCLKLLACPPLQLHKTDCCCTSGSNGRISQTHSSFTLAYCPVLGLSPHALSRKDAASRACHSVLAVSNAYRSCCCPVQNDKHQTQFRQVQFACCPHSNDPTETGDDAPLIHRDSGSPSSNVCQHSTD